MTTSIKPAIVLPAKQNLPQPALSVTSERRAGQDDDDDDNNNNNNNNNDTRNPKYLNYSNIENVEPISSQGPNIPAEEPREHSQEGDDERIPRRTKAVRLLYECKRGIYGLPFHIMIYTGMYGTGDESFYCTSMREPVDVNATLRPENGDILPLWRMMSHTLAPYYSKVKALPDYLGISKVFKQSPPSSSSSSSYPPPSAGHQYTSSSSSSSSTPPPPLSSISLYPTSTENGELAYLDTVTKAYPLTLADYFRGVNNLPDYLWVKICLDLYETWTVLYYDGISKKNWSWDHVAFDPNTMKVAIMNWTNIQFTTSIVDEDKQGNYQVRYSRNPVKRDPALKIFLNFAPMIDKYRKKRPIPSDLPSGRLILPEFMNGKVPKVEDINNSADMSAVLRIFYLFCTLGGNKRETEHMIRWCKQKL
jgi:hypothetical protein